MPLPAEILPVIERELLRAIRGRVSQVRLSDRLGYGFNQVYRWETGLTRLLWRDFVAVCEARKVDALQPIRGRFGYTGGAEDGKALAKHLLGNIPSKDAARAVGVSEHKLRSWKTGRTALDLSSMLQIMNALLNFVPEYASELVEISELPSLQKEIEKRSRQRKFFFDFPYAALALHFLTFAELRDRPVYVPGYLATKLGITRGEETLLLKAMLDAGIVALVDGHYRTIVGNLETSGKFEDAIRPRRYWSNRALRFVEKLRQRPERSVYSVDSYEASASAVSRIREAYQFFVRELHSILESDREPKDRVVVQLFQLLDAEELAQVDRAD